MDTLFVTSTSGTLLPAVQEVIDGADEAVLAVAFVAEAGVHLLKPQLQGLRYRSRLIATTVFGTTSPAALTMAQDLGSDLRILNPAGTHTYHPKVFIGRTGDRLSAVIGSANLTGGLITNVEAGMMLHGTIHDKPLQDAWTWTEKLWRRPDAQEWKSEGQVESPTGFRPALLAMIRDAVTENPIFETLGSKPKPNRVTNVTETGLWVETERSRTKHGGPEEIPAWMFELAWDTLQMRVELSNKELLNELRVHRSSAVCAILARLPGVTVTSRSPIRLGVAPVPG